MKTNSQQLRQSNGYILDADDKGKLIAFLRYYILETLNCCFPCHRFFYEHYLYSREVL